MKRDDQELLREYARENSQSAFAELVSRHLNLVWGAAVRISGDADLARDVAQTVFADLARKAASFPREASVPGWLYRASVLAARKVQRTNIRRSIRERNAMESFLSPDASDAQNGLIEERLPVLDQALATLSDADREAVVLRYLSGKSYLEIGAALRISDDTAQKRLSRAIERLRKFFAAQGNGATSAGVIALLTTAGAQAAPSGIAASLSVSALAAVHTATASNGALLTALSATRDHLIFMKTKLIVGTVTAVAIGTPLYLQQRSIAALRQEYDSLRNAPRQVEVAQSPANTRALELEQLRRDHAELERLRQEAAALQGQVAALPPGIREALAAADAELATARTKAASLQENIDSQQLREKTITVMKNIGLAARIFATDNGDKLPTAFNQITNEIGDVVVNAGLTLDGFEFMPQPREIKETEPQLALFRERVPRRLPNGHWARAYTLVDGSVQEKSFPDPAQFDEWEKQFIAQPEAK